MRAYGWQPQLLLLLPMNYVDVRRRARKLNEIEQLKYEIGFMIYCADRKRFISLMAKKPLDWNAAMCDDEIVYRVPGEMANPKQTMQTNNKCGKELA